MALIYRNLAIIFISFGLIGFGWSALADIPAAENFDTYTAGALNGQGDWSCAVNHWLVTTAKTSYGANSIVSDGSSAVCDLYATTTTEPVAFAFDFYLDDYDYNDASNYSYSYIHLFSGTQNIAAFSLFGNKLYEHGTTDLIVDGVAINVWNTLQVEFDPDNERTRIRYNENDWSDWYATAAGYTSVNHYKVQNGIVGTADYPVIYYDNFRVTDYEGDMTSPAIAPLSPTDCAITYDDPIDMVASGLISVPSNNEYNWTDFAIILENATSGVRTYFNATDTDRIAGYTDYYHVDLAMSDGAYYVSYMLSGVKVSDPLYHDVYFHTCEGTILADDVASVDAVSLAFTGTCDELEEEDCSGKTFTEQMLCEIRNTWNGAFMPSCAKMQELKQNLNSVREKFPFNYLSAATTFVSDLKDDTSSTSTDDHFNFGLMAAYTFSVAGQSLTFLSLIKGILTVVMLFMFLSWALNFEHRVFK